MTETTITEKKLILCPAEQKEGQNNRSRLWDFFFLLLFQAAWTGTLGSMFQLDFFWLLPAVGAVLFSFPLLLPEKEGKKQKKEIFFWAGAFLFFTAIFMLSGFFLEGWNLILNQAVEQIGQQAAYVFPEYPVTVSETVQPLLVSAVLCWLESLLAFLGGYLIRRGNRILLGTFLALHFLIPVFWGIAAALPFVLLGSFGLLMIWIRGHGEKNFAEAKGKVPFLSGVWLGAAALLLFGIFQIFFPFWNYEKAGWASYLEENIKEGLDQIRYGGAGENMPGGDLRKVEAFSWTGEPVLEVTMSRPDSYYLRGYIGGRFDGSRWEKTPDEELWPERDLFYWLRKSGFYGQSQLSMGALAADLEHVENVSVTVKNLAGNRSLYYVPYELRSEGAEDLSFDRQKIGEEGLEAEGLKGKDVYTFQALENQVIHYPELASAVADPEALSGEGQDYRRLEGYYNQFVYGQYLEIPEEIRAELTGLLGDYQLQEGEKHYDYSQARQNILYLLTSQYTYDESQKYEGSQFLMDFLTRSQAGYSVHYATAAAMMFRYYGIPARYVEGYLVTPEDAASMEAGEPYALDDSHAHAWVEYYQDGVGWLPFETTPAYLEVMETAEDYQDISGLASGAEGGADQEEQEAEKEEEEQEAEPPVDWLKILTGILLAAIGFMVLLILGLLIWVVWKRAVSRREKKIFESTDCRAAIRSLFNYTMNVLAAAGLPIRNISLYQYEEQLSRMFGESVGKVFLQAAEIHQEAVYSDHVISEEQRTQMKAFKDQVWERVYRQAGVMQKFRLKYIYFL